MIKNMTTKEYYRRYYINNKPRLKELHKKYYKNNHLSKKAIINKIILNYKNLDRLNDGTEWLTEILEFVNNSSLKTIESKAHIILKKLET